MQTFKLTLVIILISLNTGFAQESVSNDNNQNTKHTNLEFPNIQVIPIDDTKTKRQYELYIKLPKGYAEHSEAKYPVLYFTDAMWHIEILSGSTEYLMSNLLCCDRHISPIRYA